MAFDSTVQAAQIALNREIAAGRLPGVARLNPDGHFGPLTHGALIVYQSRNGLAPNGTLDNATRFRLLSVAATGAGASAGPPPAGSPAAQAAAIALLGPVASLVNIRDASGRVFAAPADAVVTLMDATGQLISLSSPVAATAAAVQRATVQSIRHNGFDITAMARDAAGAGVGAFFNSPLVIVAAVMFGAFLLLRE